MSAVWTKDSSRFDRTPRQSISSDSELATHESTAGGHRQRGRSGPAGTRLWRAGAAGETGDPFKTVQTPTECYPGCAHKSDAGGRGGMRPLRETGDNEAMAYCPGGCRSRVPVRVGRNWIYAGRRTLVARRFPNHLVMGRPLVRSPLQVQMRTGSADQRPISRTTGEFRSTTDASCVTPCG